MTEQEIAAVLNTYLLKCDSNELALMLAHEDVHTGILDELLLNTDINEEVRKKLKMLIGLKIRMCLVSVPDEESDEGMAPIPGGSIESFLKLYAEARQAVNFVIYNYDKMNWGNLSQQITRQALDNIWQTMILRGRVYEELAASADQFVVDPTDFKGMRLTVDMVSRAIMGHEIYERFLNETNRANSILQKLQIKLTPVTAKTKSIKEN